MFVLVSLLTLSSVASAKFARPKTVMEDMAAKMKEDAKASKGKDLTSNLPVWLGTASGYLLQQEYTDTANKCSSNSNLVNWAATQLGECLQLTSTNTNKNKNWRYGTIVSLTTVCTPAEVGFDDDSTVATVPCLQVSSNYYSDSACTQNPSGGSQINYPSNACQINGAYHTNAGYVNYVYSTSKPGFSNGITHTKYNSNCDGNAFAWQNSIAGCWQGTTGWGGSYDLSCSGNWASSTSYNTTLSGKCGTGFTLDQWTGSVVNGCQSADDDYANNELSTGGFLYTADESCQESSSSSSCFAGSETVTMESGETKLISEVAVGDRVLAFSTKTNSAVFSEVVSVPHAANNVDASFAEIATANSNIKMTPAHLLPAGTCGALSLMQAGEVKVGDCINTVSGEQVVTGVSKVQEKGIYTIVTNEEYVIVSGVVASPFAVNHFAANMFYNIHRALYNFAPYAMKSAFLAISNGIARSVASVSV